MFEQLTYFLHLYIFMYESNLSDRRVMTVRKDSCN